MFCDSSKAGAVAEPEFIVQNSSVNGVLLGASGGRERTASEKAPATRHAPVAVPLPTPNPTPSSALDAHVKQSQSEAAGQLPKCALDARSVRSPPCFDAKEEIRKGKGGFERFHIAVKPDAYHILTCVQEGELITCIRILGQHLTRDAQVKRSRLEGRAGYRCRQMSGAACVEEYFTVGGKRLQGKVYASRPEEMKRLREWISQECSVTVESTEENRANMYGIFAKMFCHVQVAGLLVEIEYELEDCTGA